MRIVDVCAFYSPRGGGVRTYVEQKLAIGPEFGHDITIIAPGDDHQTIERGPNARIELLPAPRFPLDRRYWYFADEPALHRVLDRIQPDIVEASSPWRSALMAARWQGPAPRTLIMHADILSAYAYRWLEPVFERSTIDRRMERYWAHLRQLGQAFDRVVCASLDLSTRLVDGGVANVVTNPMGVEPDLFSPSLRDPALRAKLLQKCSLSPEAHLLVAVGRLSSEKRWPLVIEAVTAAARVRPIGLIMLGEGRDSRAVVSAIGGNPHIRLFEPERDRKAFARILASADALVHGCEAETFCMVAAEARASGVPVIVPDRGGAADHARDGGGWTYKASDARSASAAILHALEHPFACATAPARTIRDHFAELFADYSLLPSHLRAA
ncbi:MAG TPA: glycosyltransferase [Croceibacterium sp.]|jgi:alpha-1,6-mannosyltransferase